MKNWKTTTAGIAGLIAILAGVAKALLDNDPTTNPDWAVVVAGVQAALVAVFAKDADVTGGTRQQ
jgi:hypothetical protein